MRCQDPDLERLIGAKIVDYLMFEREGAGSDAEIRVICPDGTKMDIHVNGEEYSVTDGWINEELYPPRRS